MQRLRSYYQKLSFTEKSAPLAFLAACILGFGLLIRSLGYYMDDWAYVFYANLKGIGSLQEMLTYDSRPYAAWLYMLGFNILGFKPIAWHILSLLMHWGIVALLWMLFRTIWPNRKIEAIQMSLLFAVYPFFMILPFPIAYTHVWFGFLAFNLSLLLMVWATKANTNKAIILTLLATILEAAHLFTGEYFAGLEFVRVLILWILISREEQFFSKKVKKVFFYWLPYLLIIGVFFYWRVAIYENPPEITRNTPVVLDQLFTEPLKAIGFLINTSLRDAFAILTTGWQKATAVEFFNFTSPFAIFRGVIALISFGLIYFYLIKLQPAATESNDDWKSGSIALAIAALLTGGLPIWLIGRSIVESKNLLSASRFGIPAIFGAALATFIFFDWLVTERKKKIVILSIIFALAINFQLANTKEFQYSWEKQTRFTQQLLWRAPQITPGTAILTDEEILGVMGEYAVSFSINTSYQVKDLDRTPPYWYFPFYYTNPNIDDLLQGAPLEYSKLSMTFSGNSKQMLLLSFIPEQQRCLWVMSPNDTNLRLVSDDMRKLSAGSDIDLIQQSADTESTLIKNIYGKQSNNTWCYYFEKADLARQYQQWDEITRLWNESQSNGERADNSFEYIPFIEGFGHLEDWGQVKDLTKFAKRITTGLEPSLCGALDRLAATAPPSQQRDDTIKELKDDLECSNNQ